MPCRDGGPSLSDILQERLDNVSAVACAAMEVIEAKGLLKECEPIVQLWWREHKKADAKRREIERLAAEQSERKRAAIAKLTPKERKLLGIF